MTDQMTADAPMIGHNVPDYAAEETARLEREFADLDRNVVEILAEARALPPSVDNEETAGVYTAAINRFTDLDNKVEATRISEKQPYLRRGTAVDSFFNSRRMRLGRLKQTDNPGGVDILRARLHAYNERRRQEEEAKRRAEEEAARKAEAEARAKREAEERAASEAEEKAARARKQENKEAAEKVAAEAAARAEQARREEEDARQRTMEAQANAAAKPADMVRERHGGGLNTMKQVGYAEITDEMKLDPVRLWPFVKTEHKEMALRAWAKTTQHKQQMEGAVVGFRNETIVRR